MGAEPFLRERLMPPSGPLLTLSPLRTVVYLCPSSQLVNLYELSHTWNTELQPVGFLLPSWLTVVMERNIVSCGAVSWILKESLLIIPFSL